MGVKYLVSSTPQKPQSRELDWIDFYVGYSFHGPLSKTWIWADLEGVPRVAWVASRHYVKEVRQMVRDFRVKIGWRLENIPVNGGPDAPLGGGMGLAAAYGPQGTLHLAYTRGEQTVLGGPPGNSYLEYMGPDGKQTELSSSEESFTAGALAVDGAGRAHLLLERHHQLAQAAALAYATNATANGGWTVEGLPIAFSARGAAVVPGAAAIAVNEQGSAYVAFVGSTRPEGKQVLVAGDSASGQWRLEVLDEDATGEPAVAANGGVAAVGYFGRDALKIARCQR